MTVSCSSMCPTRLFTAPAAAIEFVIRRSSFIRDIYVEVKRQAVHGSVDEKLPYILENAKQRLPAAATVFIYSGQGWREGAIQWIRQKAGETPGFYVMTPDEFMTWVNENL
jgi:hypothetical protein